MTADNTNTVLIKDVLLNKKKTNIFVEDNLISEIGKDVKHDADKVIDGKGKAAIPGLINTHTHAAMTLFRGYADDMELFKWLNKRIWPLEAKMTEKDVYFGTKLACLEMIKSGTTTFNDMYWHMDASARAVEDMGIRGVLSAVFIDMFDKAKAEEQIRLNEKLLKNVKKTARVIPALGPHAIYSVSKESLEWCAQTAKEKDLLIHFHLAESEKENTDFKKKAGKRPVKFLEEIGFLCKNLVACHSIFYNDDEIKTLAKHNVKIAHNPTSNMKFANAGEIKYEAMKKQGLTISLGTDGAASNNNLDMFESMKFSSLLQKFYTKSQTIMPANDVLKIATLNGAKALNINAGEIKEGKLADIVLIDLKKPEMTPLHNLVSNIVYSANGSCVDTVICDGRVLMQNRVVKGEKELLEKAQKVAEEFVNRE